MGASADRLGAGTRSAEPVAGTLRLLSPPGGGLTATPQPVLIWYSYTALDGPLAITLTPTGGFARGFVATLEGPRTAGFHALDLGTGRARIERGTPYLCTVAAAGKPLAPPALIAHSPPQEPLRSAAEAAATGYWHDALAALFELGDGRRVRLARPDALRALVESADLDLTNVHIGEQ